MNATAILIYSKVLRSEHYHESPQFYLPLSNIITDVYFRELLTNRKS